MEESQPTEPPSNDLEMLKKMEDEHLRLQRQVRMIQTDRLNRTMGVHPQFRKQDHLLGTLKKEYINLLKDLKIARSGAHKKKDRRMKIELKRALLLRIKNEMDREEGVTMMHQLDQLLHRNNKNVLHLRKRTNANKGELENRRLQSECRLVSTENKLEAAILRFNTIRYENQKIREEIEHMLKDRALFNQAWSKMMTALNKGKKFLTDLFESSTLAYDQRDEWCAKLRSVQEKGKMDQMLQVQEMRELQKAFDNEMKLYNFLAKKGVIRVNKEQERKEEEMKIQEVEYNKREYQKHLKILNEVYDYSNETNTDKIIKAFKHKESENYSLYKLLTDYCAECEVLRRDVKRIQQEVESRRDWNEMMEENRVAKLQKLKEQLQEKSNRTRKLRETLAEREQLLNDTMEKVTEIFKILECSLEPFQNLLGDKEPSLWTFNLTLRLITEKIEEYIQVAYYFERFLQKRSDKIHTSRLKKYIVRAEPPQPWTPIPLNLMVPADPCPACFEARWLSRVTDLPEVPFDKAAAKQALDELRADPAFVNSDRVHPLTECRVPRSRVILARRYTEH